MYIFSKKVKKLKVRNRSARLRAKLAKKDSNRRKRLGMAG
jgi:hypothetical protein